MSERDLTEKLEIYIDFFIHKFDFDKTQYHLLCNFYQKLGRNKIIIEVYSHKLIHYKSQSVQYLICIMLFGMTNKLKTH